MFKYYVYERITAPEWAERPDDPESFASFIPDSIQGLWAFPIKSTKYLGTRCFYVTGNRQRIDRFMGMGTDDDSETHRIWECTAFAGYLAAQKAFRKEGKLVFEKLTTRDKDLERREEIAGEAMLDAHEAGATMEEAMIVRNAVLAKLNAEAATDKSNS